MWRINVAIGVGSAWRKAYAIVVVRDDVFETILFAIAFQRRHQTVALQSFLGDLFKLRKQLAFQLALQRLPLSATHTYTHTLQLSMLELGLEFNVLPDTLQVISEAVFTANHLTDTDKQNSTVLPATRHKWMHPT